MTPREPSATSNLGGDSDVLVDRHPPVPEGGQLLLAVLGGEGEHLRAGLEVDGRCEARDLQIRP